MVEILEELQKYVPSHTHHESVKVPGVESSKEVIIDEFHQIILGNLARLPCTHIQLCVTSMYVYIMIIGGDQLTAARIRSSKRIRSNSTRGKDRLDGVETVVEDWHARMCLLMVSVLNGK